MAGRDGCFTHTCDIMEARWIVILIGVLTVDSVGCVYTPAKEKEIRQETLLSSSYDALSRPDDRTTVQIKLSILAIDELDIKSQKFTTAGWLTFEWTDSRLAWNKTAKDDIGSIFSKPATIWKPEVVIDNSLANLGVVHDDYLQIKISYDGTVHWEPLKLFTTHCSVDITFYPYDEQICYIHLVSWSYDINEIMLQHAHTLISLEDFEENGEWIVSKTSVEHKNLTEHRSGTVTIHPGLDFIFYLTRRTSYYNLNVMMPVILNSLLVMLVFLVPVESGEKLSYVLTVQLSLAVMLTLVNNSLPSTSVSSSVLGIYLGIVLIFAGVGVFLAVVIIKIYHRSGEPEVTSVIVAVARFAAKLTCHPLASKFDEYTASKISPSITYVDTATVTEGSVDKDDHKDRASIRPPTWEEVSNSINRMCLFIFTVVTITMNCVFIILLGHGSNSW